MWGKKDKNFLAVTKHNVEVIIESEKDFISKIVLIKVTEAGKQFLHGYVVDYNPKILVSKKSGKTLNLMTFVGYLIYLYIAY